MIQSIRNFREKYEEWCTLRDWSLGPVFRAKKEKERFETITNEMRVELNSIQIKKNSSTNTIISVASPWHAAFLLADLQSNMMQDYQIHQIYRGHADAAWQLIPTIDRACPDNSYTFEKLAESLIFTSLVSNLSTDICFLNGKHKHLSFYLALPSLAYRSVAQHYGFVTELLDFTADPAVAVYFASRHVSQRQSEKCEIMALVFNGKNAESINLNVKLVPPFFNRPYLQKGIFVESLIKDDLLKGFDNQITVEFPNAVYNEQFRVIRENEIDILPDCPEITEIKELANKGLKKLRMDSLLNNKESITTKEIIEFAQNFGKENSEKIKGYFKKEIITNPIKYFRNFLNEFEELMYWLCYLTSTREGPEFSVNLNNLELIVESNPEITNFVSRMYKYFISDSDIKRSISTDQIRFCKSMSEAIDQIFKDRKIHLAPNPFFSENGKEDEHWTSFSHQKQNEEKV